MTNNRADRKYDDLRKNLKIDCKKCSGLCCVALYCTKTDGFPANKEAGTPCKHLDSDFSCKIHSRLADNNYKGCLAYDCFGAGQRTTQLYLPDGTWETNSEQKDKLFQVFIIVYQLHQMLWYLVEAFTLTSDELLKSTIDLLISENEQMLQQPMDHIAMLDLSEYRSNVNIVLKQISTDISANDTSSQIHGLNYLGKNFKKANLDRKNFSMSLMIAANLSGCSLKNTNFLGADLRDANIRNADLSKSILLTQMQINSAIGNSNTKIP
ncbi:MAG TPA: hypothetical protein DDX68_09370, partial [Clostridium sp.]|nr:hypothetical protein [Clostridium sp.]